MHGEQEEEGGQYGHDRYVTSGHGSTSPLHSQPFLSTAVPSQDSLFPFEGSLFEGELREKKI